VCARSREWANPRLHHDHLVLTLKRLNLHHPFDGNHDYRRDL
jgi:hypothetical protein